MKFLGMGGRKEEGDQGSHHPSLRSSPLSPPGPSKDNGEEEEPEGLRGKGSDA